MKNFRVLLLSLTDQILDQTLKSFIKNLFSLYFLAFVGITSTRTTYLHTGILNRMHIDDSQAHIFVNTIERQSYLLQNEHCTLYLSIASCSLF